MNLKTLRALVRLEDMEGHFSVLWCNLGWKMNSTEIFLADTKKFLNPREKGEFRRNCEPYSAHAYECSVGS